MTGDRGERMGQGDTTAVETRRPRHTTFSILCNIALAAFYSLFVIAHFSAERWDLSYTLPVLVQQSIMVLTFLTRRPSFETSRRPLDWIVAVAGTLFPMLLRPAAAPGALAWLSRPLMITGLLTGAAALLSLGRSIAVVPANRGLKTGGAYRFVRHPIYATYSVTLIGYLLGSPSLNNGAVVVGAVFLFACRSLLEERLLKAEPEYQAYCEQVRWRMLPGVF